MTPDHIEAILAEFRDWLRDAASASLPAPPAGESIDLHTLVAQFTALRHEVNLLTRSARQQQEQTAETVRHYGDAVRLAAETARPRDDDAGRGLLTALVECADAQLRAARETERVAAAMKSQLEAPPAAPALAARPNMMGRLLGLGRLADQQHELIARLVRPPVDAETLRRVRDTLDAAASGLALGLQRMDRTMSKHGLEPVAALGRSFDPEAMEVVETVADSGRPAGEVVEEMLRGYRLHGRVFRFAQVKVAK